MVNVKQNIKELYEALNELAQDFDPEETQAIQLMDKIKMNLVEAEKTLDAGEIPDAFMLENLLLLRQLESFAKEH